MTYRFDEFEVDDRQFRLREGGAPVQVEPKALRLLLCLIENRDRLVRKQELLDKVWPDAMVTENASDADDRFTAEVAERRYPRSTIHRDGADGGVPVYCQGDCFWGRTLLSSR